MAASLFYNRVKYTAAAAGLVDFVTGASITGFRTPAGASIPDGTLVSYVAFITSTGEWETGQGAYTVATTTVARTTIRESSNAGAKVSFTAVPTVGVDLQAQDLGLLAPLASPTFTGTVTVPTPFTVGAVSVTATGAQLNYLAAATGTTGTTSTNLVFSTSPTLVTPALGVATATSLAINGATIGTNALAVTGTSALAGQVTNALGTITTSQPFTISQTWNAAGVTFTGMTFNVTDTASASASNLLGFQVGGTTQAIITKDGRIATGLNSSSNLEVFTTQALAIARTISGTNRVFGVSNSGLVSTISTGIYGWASPGNDGGNPGNCDVQFSRNAAGVVQVGTTAANALGTLLAAVITTTGRITTLGGAAFIATNTALTDGAAAQLGTLATAPVAGNPTKWIGINDNGTTRYIPAW